jgi:hypothetical protein
MAKNTWILGLIVVAQSAAVAATPEWRGERLEIVVHLYNPGGAPEREIRRAQTEVSWMFGKAGIHVEWISCPEPTRERGAHQVCIETTDPRTFVLSVNREDLREGASNGALGFAIVFGRANHASAIYPRILTLVQRNPGLKDGTLLGSVMAHELAHLVFRSTRHTKGVMQANWTRQDLQSMTQRRLLFTEEQAGTLRSMLAARITQASVTQVAGHRQQ